MEIILKPYQEKFYFSEERFVALIAGIGTGKTHMGLLKMWNFCKTYPDSLALLLRKQQTDAHGSTLKDFRQYFGVEFDSRNEFKFPNGSTIVAKHAGEVDALKNYNISFILWEQAEEGTEEIFDYLRDRLRRRTSPYQQLCILANANGENFLKKLFVNNAQRVNVIDESTGQREYFSEGFHCITASTFANESNLDEKFIKDLRSMEKTSPNHYRQMVLNDMTGFSSDDALFSYAELTACKRKFEKQKSYGTRIAGCDVARFGDDATCVVIMEQMDKIHWEIVHVEEWRNNNLDYSTGRILSITKQWDVQSAIIDEDGIGSGVLDTLIFGQKRDNFIGFRNSLLSADKNEDFANPRTAAAYKLRELVTKEHICITDELLIQELCTLRYRFQNDGRRILVSKNDMRKLGIPSPNRADAAIMCCTLIDGIREAQDRQYRPTNPQYSKECNLFDL